MGLTLVSLVFVFLCLQQEGKRAILLRKVFDNLDPYPEW